MTDYSILLGIKVNEAELKSLRTQINSIETDPITLKIDTAHITKQIETVRAQIRSLSNTPINLGVGMKGSSSFVDTTGIRRSVSEVNKAYNDLMNLQRRINSIRIQIGGLDSTKNSSQITELSGQLNRLMADYNNLYSTFNRGFSTGQIDSLNLAFANATGKVEALNAKMTETQSRAAKGIQINFGNYDAQIVSMETRFGNLSNKSVNLKSAIESLKQSLASMKAVSTTGDTEALINANERYKMALKDVEGQLRLNEAAEKQANSSIGLTQAKEAMSLRMSNWLKDNSAAARQFGGEIQALQAKLNSCGSTAAVKQVGADFDIVTAKAKQAGVATQTFSDKLKAQWSQYSSYFSVYMVFMYGIMAMRSMFEQVKLIDSGMTELKKVTDETAESYNKFLDNAASRAKEIGTTIDGLVSSTADFARLGYGFKEAQGLAEVANIYAVVGDEVEGVEGATESLISTMKAFKEEAGSLSNEDFSLTIVDKMNEVGNNFAISSGGIGEALKRSASSMSAANNSLDETIALITAANTVVQDPVKVGTAFKTISMRIRGAKTELEEAGEDTEGMVESTAKLREEIMALSGVDIMEND